MKQPALALLEFDSVAAGIDSADRMVKQAPIARLKVGTVHPGHYLVLIGGSVASVEEAYRVGRDAGGTFLRDELFLPDVHEDLFSSAMGRRRALAAEALGVLETNSVAALLRAADAGIKGAEVRIGELRLADDLGGRAFVLFDGTLDEVEAALEIGAGVIDRARIIHRVTLPRLDHNLRGLLTAGTRYAGCASLEPEGAELP